ncbi:MAG: M48 family metalloprotease [Methylocystis sp.]|nr:M48 family metalloprotease [Methylocystis sp.]
MPTSRSLARLGQCVATGLLAISLAACAQFELQGVLPAPGAPAPQGNVPPSAPRAGGVETRGSVEHKELVAQFGGQYRAPAAERYLDDILVKLADASDTPGQTAYKVTILNTPVVNAFALPSGNLYVTRGLLALAEDASEVAAVMAHEIAHVDARHSALRAEREREAAVITQAAAVIQNKQKGDEIGASQRLSVASFSRQQELEADAIGVGVIARAGFDPYGASRFLTALGKSSELRAVLYGKKKSALDFDILATHPSTPDRVAKAVAAARQIGAPGLETKDRAGYLAAIAGVAFGDDPAEGFVRGHNFTHPRLRFSFTAPKGFLLENSSEALFGVRGADNEALRLDSVRAPAMQSLEDYIESGWVDGLLHSSVQRIEVNGLPAVTAVARAGEWNFKLAVIQAGDELYRVIFAVRSLNEDAERRFAASIRTFRRISAEEAHDVRGLRIAIVTAAADDTAATMAARMVVPNRPLQYFLLLNGLDREGPLIAGEKYKIVTE